MLMAGFAFTASAQTTGVTALADSGVAVTDVSVARANDMMTVIMNLNMDSLRLRSNRRLVFTPMIIGNRDTAMMAPIVVNGRRQQIMYNRRDYKDYNKQGTVTVRRKNGTPQTLNYNGSVAYANWMENSKVVVAEDLCGCGDILDQNNVMLKRMFKPLIAFSSPKAEAEKMREESGRAFICFPVNKITLYPEYRQNPAELDKIVKTINLVKNDSNVTITNVTIHGYASPESPYKHNAYLAENRAATLKNHVRQLVNLSALLFTVNSTPEDWDGLRSYIKNSNIQAKADILRIANDETINPDEREAKIKKTYPAQYRFMLDTWYPALRHSDYVVTYRVRPFSVEEARRILFTNPKQLSQNEMFMVAQTYNPGSKEFNEVMEIAVRMFPDDPTANLNAACTRIEEGRIDEAKAYLAKAGDTPQAVNAQGVIAFKEGRTADAATLFRQAADAGVSEAADNLKSIDL